MSSLDISNLTKIYRMAHGRRAVLNGVDFSISKGERVGILGRNGAGKSTLIRLIGGAELPSSGSIQRGMSVSWPIAFAGGFQGSLTGIDNVRFICRVYNSRYEDVVPFIESFSELGPYMREPVRNYSSGMMAKLGFAISMAIEFDCFLVDEVLAVGDERFQEKCRKALFEDRGDRAMIMVSHDSHMIKEYCNRASVLHNGTLVNFDNVDDAYSYYRNAQ